MNRFARWQLAHRTVKRGGGVISRGTLLRIAILGIILFATLFIAGSHDFFVLSDVAISGLDSVGAARAREIIYRQRLNYFTFSTRTMVRELSRALVLENVTVKKIFPHTLVVNAHEVRSIALINTKLSRGTLASDGRVVRVFNSNSATPDMTMPIIDLQYEVTLMPHEIPIRAELLKSIRELLTRGLRLEERDLMQIQIAEPNDTVLRAHYKGGVVAMLTTDGDMQTQIEKLRSALRQYPSARTIDVRFGDKAFVIF